MILKDWFWKYQIFFNKEIYDKVIDFSTKLLDEEKDIFLEEVSFFKGFYTFQMLLDAIEDCKEIDKNINIIIDIAKQNIDKIINIDDILYLEYKNRINIFSDKYKNELYNILQYSHEKSKLFIDVRQYLSILLNNVEDFYGFINSQTRKPYNRENVFVCEKNIKSLFEDIYKTLNSNKSIKRLFGDNNIGAFDLIIKEENGYGEFWDSDIYDDYDKNTLILKSNSGNLTYNDLVYTIVHEVYPGHAHFFKETKSNNICYDTGALFLIEGFATVCELLIDENPNYVNNLKSKYLTIIKAVLDKDLQNLKDKYLDYYKEMKKYPMYYESYYLGAYYILYLLETKRIKNIKDYLSLLKNKNIGNFFKIYFQ